MGSNYQHLEKYKGSLYGNLNYQGIEYDFEVPDNIVVASPGGVSGIHHHYTKGIYSDASSTRDIYAGEGDGYPYGEYGNVYQVGQSASRYMGDFVEPPDMSPSRGTGYTQNQGSGERQRSSSVESFGPVGGRNSRGTNADGHSGNMELITPSSDVNAVPYLRGRDSTEGSTGIGSTPIPDSGESPKTPNTNLIAVLKLLTVFTAGYLAANFWVKAGDDYITTNFYGDGTTMGWKQYAIIATIITAAIVAFAYFFGIPLGTLEKI